jgi:hypothetical protein
VHLGMSGSLRVLTAPAEPCRKHDHLEWCWRRWQPAALSRSAPFRRRAVGGASDPASKHPLLAGLGPEPLGAGLRRRRTCSGVSRGRRSSVKQLLMDGHGGGGSRQHLRQRGAVSWPASIRAATGRAASRLARYAHAGNDAVRAGARGCARAVVVRRCATMSTVTVHPGTSGSSLERVRARGASRVFGLWRGRYARLRHAQRSTFYCPRCQR